jgi:hypothetical protein
MTSFGLWFDHQLLEKGEAYSEKTGQFFSYTDTRVPSTYNVFGSPYKQFITDSSITGATIPTGVYVNGSEETRSDGVIFDFDNGRIISSGILATDTVTGTFSVKDFNIYFTNESEEDLLIERKYDSNSAYPSTNTNIDPYDYNIPAAFINSQLFMNEPFAYGGMDKTLTTVNVLVICNNAYELDGILSIFADSRNEAFAVIPFSGHPINEWGDLKSSPYDYDALAAQYTNKFYVESVVASKLSDKSKSVMPHSLYVGFLDFDVYTHRFPRQ